MSNDGDSPVFMLVLLMHSDQIFSMTLFEKTPILRALQHADSQDDLPNSTKQLNLFDF